MADEHDGDGPFPDDEPQSIADRAANGENEQDAVEPPEPPMEVEGSAQLSMNLGGVVSNRNARKVEGATLRLMGGKRDVAGLLDIDSEYNLLVRVRPDAPAPKALRDANTGRTRAFELDQQAQVLHIRVANADAIRDLFADLLGNDAAAAGALLDELQQFTSEEVRAAA